MKVIDQKWLIQTKYKKGKIPRRIRQNAITEGDLERILTRNCEGTEQLQ